jgi:hypothetical protein
MTTITIKILEATKKAKKADRVKESLDEPKGSKGNFNRRKAIEYRKNKKSWVHQSSKGDVRYEDMSTEHIINTIALYLKSEASLVSSCSPEQVVRLIEDFGLMSSVYDLVDELKVRI